MIVLGVDPGLADTGWGVVEFDGQHYRPVSFGTVKTSSSESQQKRIYTIAEDLGTIAMKYSADVVSMEDIFFTKNITSAIPVAKVIGAAIYKFSTMSLPVHLYSPLDVKMAVTGMGRAEKIQVQEMVKVLLHLKEIPRPDHAADALADCICYCTHNALKVTIRS